MVTAMPYDVKQNGENWDVVNTETQEVKATHTPPDAEEKARKQVRLLHSLENDSRWEGDGDGG